MKKFMKKNWAWFIVAICLIGFAIIVYNLNINNLSNFDNNLYNALTIIKNDQLTLFFKLITYFCEPVTILVALVLIFIISKNKINSILFGLASCGSFGINYIIKHIAKRPRPLDIALVKETGYSFPSSHAMISIAFYGFIMYLILKSNLKKYVKIILSICIILIIISVSISRIYLGVHNASDVLAGLLLSTAFTITYIKLIYNKKSSK